MSTQHSGGAGTVVYSLKTPRIHIVKVTVSLAALRAAQEEEVLRFIRFQLEFSQMFRQQQDNMEVTAHCLRLVMLLLILLNGHVHNSAFRIIPTKLQLFQYESVSFHCEGLDGSTQLRGIRNTEGFLSVCDFREKTTASCTIDRAYRADSGEYWCETKGGKRSNIVSVTVIAGPVILESPVLPVMEGDSVILRCRMNTSLSVVTYFYKDSVKILVANSSTGEITIRSVSKSDEGLYKCYISDVGESPQSLLIIKELHAETSSSSHHFIQVFLFLRTVFTIVMVALLLLLVGLLHFRKL
ncbi:low affinity immunoglobulin gamma Fc region receptor II-like [Channa argus]|uniref:low affinity immunoglobulin gamma Fc region receptor II-like n=1 Tax=Channa argus TaxID=215402 RepID=UPI0035215DF9